MAFASHPSSLDLARLTPSDSSGMPLPTEALALANFGLTMLFSTGLAYFWLPFSPMWLVMAMLGLMLSFSHPRLRQTVVETTSILFKPLILPWLGYVMVIFIRDVLDETIADSFTNRVGVNLACLVLFVYFASAASACSIRRVLMVLAVLAALQGGVAIAQYIGSFTAWRLPDLISSYSARDSSLYYAIAGGDSAIIYEMGFASVGRARGLDVVVHKFGTHLGILAVFLAIYVVLWGMFSRRTMAILIIGLASLVGIVGLAFSFSRAPIIGAVLGGGLAMFFTFQRGRMSPLLALGFFALMTVAALLYFRISESAQFERLLMLVDLQGGNDYSRLESIRYSWNLFLSSPLFGSGSSSMQMVALPTHNVPLRVLGDFGIVGFVFYAMVWICILRVFWKAYHSSFVFTQVLAVSCFGAFLVAFVDNMTHSSGLLQRDIAQSALFGVMVGLCLGALRRDRNIARSGVVPAPRAHPTFPPAPVGRRLPLPVSHGY